MKLTFPAAIVGRLPATRVGLLMIVPVEAPGALEDCVAIEDVEFERVGDEGLAVGPRGAGGGEGAIE
jgi:hypothetical protein